MTRPCTFVWIKDYENANVYSEERSGCNVVAGMTKSGKLCLMVIAVASGPQTLKGKLIMDDRLLMRAGMFDQVWNFLRGKS